MVDPDIVFKLSQLLSYESGKKFAHELIIDCPDCGRTMAHKGNCGKCGGKSWLHAGHTDRFNLTKGVAKKSIALATTIQ